MPESEVSAREHAALAVRIRVGDASAEEEFVRRFGSRIFVMILARIRNREDAREVAQDVMTTVLSALRGGQLREPEKLAAFVHGTGRNLANNFLRSHIRTPELVPLSPEMAFADPINERELAEQLSLVKKALEHLDALDRRILLMSLVEGSKPGEIATDLGLSSEVVRTRKSRAIRKVAEIVKGMSRK
jgi:RNA polymerase sigma-70 factor (ECF subfamily)